MGEQGKKKIKRKLKNLEKEKTQKKQVEKERRKETNSDRKKTENGGGGDLLERILEKRNYGKRNSRKRERES